MGISWSVSTYFMYVHRSKGQGHSFVLTVKSRVYARRDASTNQIIRDKSTFGSLVHAVCIHTLLACSVSQLRYSGY